MKTTKTISKMLSVVALLALSVPAIAADMDDRIESSAKQSYVFKTYLQGDDINIQSKDGAVTLTGVVHEESHKSLAQDTVTDLPGVVSVHNKLEIKESVADKNSDAWLLTKLKTTLLFHRSVSATTTIEVKGGVVTLRGEADNQAQKELTTEYVKDVDGVKDVKNEMTLAKSSEKKQTLGENIDDSSITAQVKMSLLYHRSTSALKTKVTTKDGAVTLDGKAKNAAEITLATKLASDVKGVKSVKNTMIIE